MRDKGIIKALYTILLLIIFLFPSITFADEGGREAVEALGYKLDSIITRDEVMERYKK